MALYPWQKRLIAAYEASDKYNRHGGKAALARSLEISPGRMRTYFTKPIDKPRADFLKRLAGELEVSLEWLRDGLKNGKLTLQIVGCTAAGETWIAYDTTESLGEFELDFDLEDPVAVEVQGDSMRPVYRPGDLLVAARGNGDLHKKDCIVETTDGRRYVKFVLENGKGGYILRSYNPEYDDQEVDGLSKGYPIRLVIRN